MRASPDLGVEALDFVVEIVGHGIQSHADRKIRRAAESFSSPVGTLIQPMQNFDKADGVDLINAAGFRIIADGRRIAGDGENVANAAHGPRAESSSLQATEFLMT